RSGASSRRPGQRLDGLRTVRQALALPPSEQRSRRDLGNAAIACLCLPDIEVAREWDVPPNSAAFVEFEPSFQRYARADFEGNISIRRVADDGELARLPGLGKVLGYGGLLFSPDGRFLAQRYEAGGQFRLTLWRL